jgi:hypothetical protein
MVYGLRSFIHKLLRKEKFSEVHIQHPAYLRPYESGGWPIAPPECRRGPQDLGYWIVMRLGANPKNTKRSELRFCAALEDRVRVVCFERVTPN